MAINTAGGLSIGIYEVAVTGASRQRFDSESARASKKIEALRAL
jgi:hypothetical protein